MVNVALHIGVLIMFGGIPTMFAVKRRSASTQAHQVRYVRLFVPQSDKPRHHTCVWKWEMRDSSGTLVVPIEAGSVSYCGDSGAAWVSGSPPFTTAPCAFASSWGLTVSAGSHDSKRNPKYAFISAQDHKNGMKMWCAGFAQRTGLVPDAWIAYDFGENPTATIHSMEVAFYDKSHSSAGSIMVQTSADGATWQNFATMNCNSCVESSATFTSDLHVQVSTNPSAVGDPHLTNLRGERFDIHDGLHRLVHYPRGVPEDEALLIVDVQAVDMGHEANCYSVYLQNIRIFGKWVGEDIVIRTDTNSSVADSGPSALRIFFAGEQMDWPFVAKHQDVRLSVHGIMPVTVNANMRKAAGEDAMGGEEITFKIGDQSPVLVQVWSSHGTNQLTGGKEVRYLNLEVQNLPKGSGGIIGLDSYSRPSSSKCDLVQEERSLMDYIQAENGTLSLLRLLRPRWTASVFVQQ